MSVFVVRFVPPLPADLLRNVVRNSVRLTKTSARGRMNADSPTLNAAFATADPDVESVKDAYPEPLLAPLDDVLVIDADTLDRARFTCAAMTSRFGRNWSDSSVLRKQVDNDRAAAIAELVSMCTELNLTVLVLTTLLSSQTTTLEVHDFNANFEAHSFRSWTNEEVAILIRDFLAKQAAPAEASVPVEPEPFQPL